MSSGAIIWEPYSRGGVNDFTALDRNGKPYTGEHEDWMKMHGTLCGLRNRITGKVILLNKFDEIAARGHKI